MADEKSVGSDKHNIDRRMMQITGLIAFCNLILIAITIFQAYDNHKAIAGSDESFKKKFDLAKRSFDSSMAYTRQQLKYSDSTLYANKKYTDIFIKEMEIENRANVAMDDKSFRFSTNKESIALSLSGSNVGKTPAYNLKKMARVVIADSLVNPRSHF